MDIVKFSVIPLPFFTGGKFYCLCSVLFKSKENEKVLDKLVKEVRGLNPTFNSADIRGKLTIYILSIEFQFLYFYRGSIPLL